MLRRTSKVAMTDDESGKPAAPDWDADPWPRRIEILNRMLDHVSNGGTVRDFSRQRKAQLEGEGELLNPCFKTLYTWLNECEKHGHELSARIVRARARGYDAIAQEMLSIADEDPAEAKTFDGEGTEISSRIDPGDVQNRKLRIETREKLLAKWDPGRYGNKIEVEHKADASFGDVLEAARKRALRSRERTPESVDDDSGENVG